jgi:hypothetical protein
MVSILKQFRLSGGWLFELAAAVVCLGLGFGLMPLLIFYAGATSLGRYEGASPGGIYDAVFQGLSLGSSASWTVVLGPYVLYLLFKVLRLWWRAGSGVTPA